MKGCFKLLLYGFLGFVALTIVVAILNPNSVDSKRDSKVRKRSKSENRITSKEESKEKKELTVNDRSDIHTAKIVDQIKEELKKCYESAINMMALSGVNLENERAIGMKSYNQAYKLYLKLQTGNILPRAKTRVINAALGTYSDVFNNKYSLGNNYKAEVDFINENIEKFPDEITQIEKDNKKNIFRVILSENSNKQIGLPSRGIWCLWEISGSNRIIIEGVIPNHGYSKFDVHSSQLPIYLGKEKRFTITNTSGDLHLIFRKCEKK